MEELKGGTVEVGVIIRAEAPQICAQCAHWSVAGIVTQVGLPG